MQRQNLFYDLKGKYGVVVPGNLMDELFNYAIQKNADTLIDANIIEKLEREQVDNILSVRWSITSLSRYNLYNWEPTLEETYYKRYQSGLIYKPNAQLLVIYSDSDVISGGDLSTSSDKPLIDLTYFPMLFTTTAMWKQLGIKGNYMTAYLSKDGAIELLQLKPLIVPHILWTDEYDLPPLSVDAINKTIDEIKESITPQRSR